MGIGRRIKEAREALHLTQKELGDLVGVTGSSITNYENETSHPKEPIMYKLINELGIDANFLFQDSVNTKKSPPSEDEDDIKKQLIENYDSMNDAGQHELLKHSKLLANADEYKKCDQFGVGKSTA